MSDQPMTAGSAGEPETVGSEPLRFADRLIIGTLKFAIMTWYLPVLLVTLALVSLAVVIWQCVLALELCWHRLMFGWANEVRHGWKPRQPIDLAEEGV
jgi:hypothetical protein